MKAIYATQRAAGRFYLNNFCLFFFFNFFLTLGRVLEPFVIGAGVFVDYILRLELMNLYFLLISTV